MKLAIKEGGSGQNLVLLHGWGMNSSIWDSLLPELQRNFNVICVDLPGHGQSKCDATWTMEQFVDVLADQLPKQCVILGWSLGGMLALRYAAKYPSRVSGLIMLASSAKFVRSKDWRQAQPKAVLQIFADKLLENPNASIKRFLLLQTQGMDDQAGLNRLLVQVLANDKLPNLAGLKSGLDILATADLRLDLANITSPLLQILGAKDQLVPLAVAADSKSLSPTMQSVVVKGAAHVPFISHPTETIKAIRAFCLV
ncbi:MAG: pimeloyl-[acyl-carrier protein] methyl ester esterase [Piscirickettsiaceae bacterium]|nr:MAG: pimeloyl-[acyl-carrier protein] methyl ester esterase [Piscirickettsiaceae bacterium]